MLVIRPALLALVLIGFTAASCQEFTDLDTEPQAATLSIGLAIAGSSIETVVAVVTAPDIDPPITDTLQAQGDSVSGTLTIPAGSDRILTLSGYDANDVETHRGADTLTIQAGSNPPVTITLEPLTGEVEVIGVLGDLLSTAGNR